MEHKPHASDSLPTSVQRSTTSHHLSQSLSRKSQHAADPIHSNGGFEATVISSARSGQTFSFTPLTTVLRAHIPLSWLSSVPEPDEVFSGSLLRASIPSVSRWDYQILVASLTPSGHLYAFERIEVDLFVCHALRSWVSSEWVHQAAFGAAPSVQIDVLLQSQNLRGHNRNSSISSTTSPVAILPLQQSSKLPRNRRGHLARLSILDTKERTEESQSQTLDENAKGQGWKGVTTPNDNAEQVSGSSIQTSSLVKQSCPELLRDPASTTLDPNDGLEKSTLGPKSIPIDQLSTEYLRDQYFDTLYLSKTSLAFYAKGPLSRARARARLPTSSRCPEELADFYRESVLTTKKIDLKYRDSIENQIKLLGPDIIDAADSSLPLRKQRMKRRTKLGKDGLWPAEKEYIARWWREQDKYHATSNTPEAHLTKLKVMISELRLREIELQIVLILEILALEKRDICKESAKPLPNDPDIKLESVEEIESGLLKVSKTINKKRDLPSELDFLVDRLCILHSIGSDSSIGMGSSDQEPTSASNKIRDRMNDFCKDVIVPFYGGKLPDHCQAICNKLGRPEISPRRARLVSEKDSSQSAPGAAINRNQSTKATKRTLQRVLSDDHDAHQHPLPSLSRSATLPTPVSVKREPSERPISRSGMQKSVSFSNREVDLVADARITATKRRKLDLVAAQKRELDAAIETLKRPNRHMVAKCFMDDVEGRAKERKPIVKKVEPVQISATPKRAKIRNIEAEDEYDLPPIPSMSAPQSESVIPSSTARPRGLTNMSSVPRSSATKRAVLSAIHDTPTRKRMDVPIMQDSPQSDEPTKHVSSVMLAASTPARSQFRQDAEGGIAVTPLQMHRSHKEVTFTPMVRSAVGLEQAFRDAPEISEQAGKIMDRAMGSKSDAVEVSIYESLGWDDDYDL